MIWRVIQAYNILYPEQERQRLLEGVRQNGMDLQYASLELKNDPGIVLEAVRQNGMALQHASPELQNNYNISVSHMYIRRNLTNITGYILEDGILIKKLW